MTRAPRPSARRCRRARAAVAAVVGAVGDVKDRRRAKNREAAARCRVKRLAGVAAMKAENEELRARNAALEREVAALRAENAKLLGAHAGAAAAGAALDRQRGEFDTALHPRSAGEATARRRQARRRARAPRSEVLFVRES